MSAIIRNYNLSISEPNESYINPPFKVFKPFWDGWVEDEDDISNLLSTIRYQMENGRKPIVAMFIE